MKASLTGVALFLLLMILSPLLAKEIDASELPTNALVSYWPAEGSAKDSVGSNDGTLLNGASFAPGISGQAFSLDGKDDYVLVPNSPSLNFGVQNFSLTLWIKTRFSRGGVGTDFLISKGSFGTFFNYTLQYNSNIDSLALFSVGAASGQGEEYVSAGPKLGDGKWHHIVGVREGTEIRLYIDCALAARSGCFGCQIINSTGPWNVVIGGRESPGNDPYFQGEIDEVAIYDRALSQEEIVKIYRSTASKACPTGNNG
jgi:concanavalin A-like lectin/glucanase superfamily protein